MSESSSAGIELIINKSHTPEVIVFRASWLQCTNHLLQFAFVFLLLGYIASRLVPVVLIEQVFGEWSTILSVSLTIGIDIIIFNLAPVYLESEIISIADFAICDIHFYDSKTIAYIGIFAIHVDIVYGLVSCG